MKRKNIISIVVYSVLILLSFIFLLSENGISTLLALFE